MMEVEKGNKAEFPRSLKQQGNSTGEALVAGNGSMIVYEYGAMWGASRIDYR